VSVVRGARNRGGHLTEGQIALLERHVALMAHDDVVKHFNVQELTGTNELAGNLNVFRGRGGIAGGVVVDNNYGSGIDANSSLKEPYNVN
jgi:hypothetical protein